MTTPQSRESEETPADDSTYDAPRAAGDEAWAPDSNPMGEGSDDTAVPDVDPAERRLSEG
jgi:hypothetical protein